MYQVVEAYTIDEEVLLVAICNFLICDEKKFKV